MPSESTGVAGRWWSSGLRWQKSGWGSKGLWELERERECRALLEKGLWWQFICIGVMIRPPRDFLLRTTRLISPSPLSTALITCFLSLLIPQSIRQITHGSVPLSSQAQSRRHLATSASCTASFSSWETASYCFLRMSISLSARSMSRVAESCFWRS
ncbi:hypothetical protein EYF80_041676 [Liparis tanakae]|uniref:Uncharacterized protein n=1 Tax=Liparis tanakae TaxID=230148 RepID=A0A4Z2G4U2_9TELE|nr:hypothetical protein EYF80_041676 [Liparis tanakae]